MPSTVHARSASPFRSIVPAAAAVVLLLPAAVAAQNPDDWCRDTDRNQHCEVRQLRFEARGRDLDIDVGPNGGVQVEGYTGSEVRVTARVVARARSESAARDIAGRVEVRAADGRIHATGPRTMGRDSWSVSVRVQAPVGTAISARTTNGTIVVSATNAAVQARTTNGSIRLTDVAGRVDARSTNGTIRAAISAGAASFEAMELRTTNGSVTLTVPERTSAQLELSTTNGRVTSDLPITIHGRVNPRRLSGTLGDGGPTIRVSTTNGSIRVAGH